MTEREKLIATLNKKISNETTVKIAADHLLKNNIIIPIVNIGDIVFIKNEPVEIESICIDQKIHYEAKINCEKYDCCDCPFYDDYVSQDGEHDCKTYGSIEFTSEDIDKTVFLTKQEN